MCHHLIKFHFFILCVCGINLKIESSVIKGKMVMAHGTEAATLKESYRNSSPPNDYPQSLAKRIKYFAEYRQLLRIKLEIYYGVCQVFLKQYNICV